MGPPVCSVSRSVEEAALDDEWPGKPLHNYIQTTIKLVPKPSPKSPPKSSTPKTNARDWRVETRDRRRRESTV